MSNFFWTHSSVNNSIHPNAVVGGRDSDGTTIYVGRAYFSGDRIPCKILPQKRAAYVAHGGGEHEVTTFEVLCEKKLEWVRSSSGQIPPGAVEGGRTASGETLYIGRTSHRNSQTVGKVHPSHGCLYISYGGQEHSYRSYEILVSR